MNKPMTVRNDAADASPVKAESLQVEQGKTVGIGTGFHAVTFREKDFFGAMDPLVMVDHYRMSEPTFGPHPHAGLSAVSVLFEDSEGAFHNRDTLGNDFDLLPGDVYWLKAGAGVVHDEAPREGARIHGLQVFVNLPDIDRASVPASRHVPAEKMPFYESQGSRVRILLGRSNGLTGALSPAQPMTMLDGHLQVEGRFHHTSDHGENVWIVAIKGDMTVARAGQQACLSAGQAIALSPLEGDGKQVLQFRNAGANIAHFVLFAAAPLGESFVQKGPYVAATQADIQRIEADYAAGKFGYLN